MDILGSEEEGFKFRSRSPFIGGREEAASDGNSKRRGCFSLAGRFGGRSSLEDRRPMESSLIAAAASSSLIIDRPHPRDRAEELYSFEVFLCSLAGKVSGGRRRRSQTARLKRESSKD